jgi:hypothetical protein
MVVWRMDFGVGPHWHRQLPADSFPTNGHKRNPSHFSLFLYLKLKAYCFIVLPPLRLLYQPTGKDLFVSVVLLEHLITLSHSLESAAVCRLHDVPVSAISRSLRVGNQGTTLFQRLPLNGLVLGCHVGAFGTTYQLPRQSREFLLMASG